MPKKERSSSLLRLKPSMRS